MPIPLASPPVLGPSTAPDPRHPSPPSNRMQPWRPSLSPRTRAAVNIGTFAALVLYWLCSVTGSNRGVARLLAVATHQPAATAGLRDASDVFSGFPLPVSTNPVEAEPVRPAPFFALPGLSDEEGPDGMEEEEEDGRSPLASSWRHRPARRALLPFAPQVWLLLVVGGAAASFVLGAKGRRASHLLSVFTPLGQTTWQESSLSMLAITGRVEPATIVGDGPKEQQLAATNADSDRPDVVLTADQWVGADGLPSGPVLYCGAPDGVDAAIKSIPAARRGDLVLLQNGALDVVLERYGLQMGGGHPKAVTQCLVDLALAEDGRLVDRQPEGLTAACGRFAEDVATRLAAAGIECQVKDDASYRAVLVRSLVPHAAFSLVGARFGLATVREVEARRALEVSLLVKELLAACRAAHPGASFDAEDVVVDSAHLVYAPSHAEQPTDLDGFPYFNGFFWAVSQRAIAAGCPDPCPLHSQWVRDVGLPGTEGPERTCGAARLMVREANGTGCGGSKLKRQPEPLAEVPLIPVERMVGTFGGRSDRLAEELLTEFECCRMRKQDVVVDVKESVLKKELKDVASGLGILLSNNCFIIVTFFWWFVAAVVLAHGFKNDFLLLEFRSKWEIIILPLLSIHMALTFLRKGLEVAAEKLE